MHYRTSRCFATATLLLWALLACVPAWGGMADGRPIRAGSEYEYPPFATQRPDGTVDGFSVDLLRAVLRVMGHEVEFESGPWHVLKDKLADGRLEVLPLMARTEARRAHYDFSVPWFTMHGTLVVRKGEQRIRDLADLRGREVMVMRGDIADEYMQTLGLTGKIFRTETVEQALRALDSGQHDAVVVQKLAGQELIRKLRLTNIETVGPPITAYQQMSFAVRKGDHELLAVLNEGLALVVADGTFARLQDKWLAPVQEERVSFGQVAVVVAITLAFAAAVAFLWQRSLRRQVQARTEALHQSNLSFMREIVEHHETEQALRRKTEELEATFANVHVQLAIMDREFNFLQVNEAFAAHVGQGRESFVGRNLMEFCDDEENRAIFHEVVTAGEPYSVAAKPVGCGDTARAVTYWDWTITPVKDPTDRVEALVYAVIDATERERQRQQAENASRRSQELLERRVSERTAELEAAYEELESFSYSVSHDLRGPLRAINGYSHILADDFIGAMHPDTQLCLDRIRETTLRMGELIDGLLDLARVFRSELQVTEVDLSALAHELVGMLLDAERRERTEIRIQPGVTATGDPTLLRVALQNLLGNALKFTRQRNPAVIEFGTERQGGRLIYSVRDNGAGFDMRFAHKLFQPFERLHDGSVYEGTGIGLATVRRIVVRHRGRVWAEGVQGAGTRVCFTLNEL